MVGVHVVVCPPESCVRLTYASSCSISLNTSLPCEISFTKAIDSLNFREKNGYEPLWLPLYSFESHTSPPKLLIERALTYVATPSNSSFLGFATHDQIAQHISTCNGPSGSNLDYIHNLHHALERLGYPDPHLASIVRAASG